MKKETLKTMILTLLIFSSVILSVQLLLDDPAWTDDYSLLSMLTGANEKDEAININDTGALSSVFSPSSFLLTYGDGRLYYSTTQAEGKDIRTPFNRVLKTALNTPNAESVSEDKWKSALQSQGVYADYFVPVSVDAMSAFLGNTASHNFAATAFDCIVICFDSITAGGTVYLRDSAQNKQISIPVGDVSSLFSAYEAQAATTKQSYAYAYELNLDKKMDSTDVQQNVLLDSYVLLPLEPHAMNIIRSEIPAFGENTTEKILSLFGYNPKIARKYTDNDGNQLFIDQDSTLTLNPEKGYLKYEAESGTGVVLPGDSSLSSTATGCGKLLDDLFKLFETDSNVTLFINTPLTKTSGQNYTISFGYLFNGNPIVSKRTGCEIRVENGKITSFTANLRNYVQIAEAEPRHAIEVLDYLYSTQEKDMLVVNELYTGYTDGAGELPLRWKAGVQGREEIITVE